MYGSGTAERWSKYGVGVGTEGDWKGCGKRDVGVLVRAYEAGRKNQFRGLDRA